MLDPQAIEAIQKLSKEHEGVCPDCHQNIRFYRYGINKSVCIFLRAMAERAQETQQQVVDISELQLPYSIRTQVTKCRLHGLITKVRQSTKEHEPNHWLITTRGWAFLRGEPLPKQTVVYNNQTLGHEGPQITIHDIMSDRRIDEPYEAAPATPAEARTYQNVHTPQRHVKLQAVRVSGSKGSTESQEIEIDRLVVGKPIKLLAPFEYEYKDIAAFRRAWRIV